MNKSFLNMKPIEAEKIVQFKDAMSKETVPKIKEDMKRLQKILPVARQRLAF